MDRIKKLSEIIVNHSVKVKENDKVLITYMARDADYFVKCLVKNVLKNKGIPCVKYKDPELEDLIKNKLNDKIIENRKNILEFEVSEYDSFIQIHSNLSDYYEKNVDKNMSNKMKETLKPFKDILVNKRHWVLLNYPSLVDAYKAGMTYEEFFNFALDVMTVDYDKMYKDMLPLKKLMERTDKVRITGKNTDITFSIKGLPAIICSGESNIPDGEVFTAPVKNFVNGTITYNTPSPYNGYVYHDVSLTFKDGKIVECHASNDEDKLQELFETDEGSKYVGEFSFGLNPKIMKPMGDILFDEKIAGSIHFTPGSAYSECDNGNKSNIHFDMVLIQREEFGGGDIYFDDVLVRHDGKFVLEELKNLNYEE
ncbi:MAG: aminopeptidase [Bacilli bacterium]|nr:aminopeptidase [Bacilli bacterium]